MEPNWLIRKLAIEEAETLYMESNKRLGSEPVPFVFINEARQYVARVHGDLWQLLIVWNSLSNFYTFTIHMVKNYSKISSFRFSKCKISIYKFDKTTVSQVCKTFDEAYEFCTQYSTFFSTLNKSEIAKHLDAPVTIEVIK